MTAPLSRLLAAARDVNAYCGSGRTPEAQRAMTELNAALAAYDAAAPTSTAPLPYDHITEAAANALLGHFVLVFEPKSANGAAEMMGHLRDALVAAHGRGLADMRGRCVALLREQQAEAEEDMLLDTMRAYKAAAEMVEALGAEERTR